MAALVSSMELTNRTDNQMTDMITVQLILQFFFSSTLLIWTSH